MVIAIGASAVLGVSFYLNRKTKRLQSKNQDQFPVRSNYRPLFEPTDDEIRALEREEEARQAAKIETELRQIKAGKIEDVRDFQKIWQNQSNKGNTLELLRLAAVSETAQIFSEISEKIIKVWYDRKIDNLSARDLADLLDSHLRTLPQQERTSGILFWLKQEILSLRRKSEDK